MSLNLKAVLAPLDPLIVDSGNRKRLEKLLSYFHCLVTGTAINLSPNRLQNGAYYKIQNEHAIYSDSLGDMVSLQSGNPCIKHVPDHVDMFEYFTDNLRGSFLANDFEEYKYIALEGDRNRLVNSIFLTIEQLSICINGKRALTYILDHIAREKTGKGILLLDKIMLKDGDVFSSPSGKSYEVKVKPGGGFDLVSLHDQSTLATYHAPHSVPYICDRWKFKYDVIGNAFSR